jgi:hypothetical protein
MTKEQVKEILDRVLTWPPKRQEDAARVLSDMEAQDASPYHLTNEQVEEIRRRRQGFRDGTERNATDEEVAALWKKCGLRKFDIDDGRNAISRISTNSSKSGIHGR